MSPNASLKHLLDRLSHHSRSERNISSIADLQFQSPSRSDPRLAFSTGTQFQSPSRSDPRLAFPTGTQFQSPLRSDPRLAFPTGTQFQSPSRSDPRLAFPTDLQFQSPSRSDPRLAFSTGTQFQSPSRSDPRLAFPTDQDGGGGGQPPDLAIVQGNQPEQAGGNGGRPPSPAVQINQPDVSCLSIAEIQRVSQLQGCYHRFMRRAADIIPNPKNLKEIVDALGKKKFIVCNIIGAEHDQRWIAIQMFIKCLLELAKANPVTLDVLTNADDNIYMWKPIFIKFGTEEVGVCIMSTPHQESILTLQKILNITNLLASENVIVTSINGTAKYFQTYLESGMIHHSILVISKDRMTDTEFKEQSSAAQTAMESESKINAISDAYKLIDRLCRPSKDKEMLRLKVRESSCFSLFAETSKGLSSFIKSHFQMDFIKNESENAMEPKNLMVHAQALFGDLNSLDGWYWYSRSAVIFRYFLRVLELCILVGLLIACTTDNPCEIIQFMLALTLVFSSLLSFLKDTVRFCNQVIPR